MPLALLFGLDQFTRRRQTCVQVKCRAGDQNVQAKPEHANGLTFTDFTDRRMADVGGVHDGHSAATLDLDGLVRSDKGSRVFIQTDPDREWIVGQGRDQAPETVALTEMLTDEPSSPKAIICSLRMLAPALVPPTVTPWALRTRMSFATGVPPSRVVSRN